MKKCEHDPVSYDFSPSPRVVELLGAKCPRPLVPAIGIVVVPGTPAIGRSESGPPFDLGAPVTGGAPR